MIYEVKFTTKFKKDLKTVQKQGKKLDKLFAIVENLANDVELQPNQRDHELTGDYVGLRECHIEPDWLLVYKKNKTEIILYLVRTGSHSDLF